MVKEKEGGMEEVGKERELEWCGLGRKEIGDGGSDVGRGNGELRKEG